MMDEMDGMDGMDGMWEGEVLKAFLLRYRLDIVSITLGN